MPAALRNANLFLLLGLSALFLSACDPDSTPAHVLGAASSSSEPSLQAGGEQFRVVDYAIPETPYCQPLRDWDPALIALEQEVLELSNAARAQGLDCGERGNFPPAPPLKLNSALSCAARAHSKYLRDAERFEHLGPDGQTPGERIALTEYPVTAWGENIAYGYPTAQAVVEGWKNSDVHCANLMRSYYTQMGVGVIRGGERQIHWTQVMAIGDDLAPNFEAPASSAPVFGGFGALLLGLGLGCAVFGARRNR